MPLKVSGCNLRKRSFLNPGTIVDFVPQLELNFKVAGTNLSTVVE